MNKIQSPLEAFHSIPRMPLVNLGTPIERCTRIEKEIPHSPNIFIKRDDFLGYLVGGNKVRKLEYVMADVRAKGATAVVTIGSVQSNHARVTAFVARRCGLKCALVLNGALPERPTANYFIDSLLGVEIHSVGTREERAGRMEEVAAGLRARGENVYTISLGASDETGAFGFVNAFEELLRQEKDLGIKFDAIVFASSSGGTQAGLEVGKRLFGKRGLLIIGISPDNLSGSIRGAVAGIMVPMLKRLGLKDKPDPSEIIVDDHYIGEGYGIPSGSSLEATGLFVGTEGILLDPVYTCKAASGLLDYCRSGRFPAGWNVLFWHTGGLVALFE